MAKDDVTMHTYPHTDSNDDTFVRCITWIDGVSLLISKMPEKKGHPRTLADLEIGEDQVRGLVQQLKAWLLKKEEGRRVN